MLGRGSAASVLAKNDVKPLLSNCNSIPNLLLLATTSSCDAYCVEKIYEA